MTDNHDVNMESGYRCPICERGKLLLVRKQVWHCSRNACNSEFFYDEWEPGSGNYILNCRDKPTPPCDMTPKERSGCLAIVFVILFLCVVAYRYGVWLYE